MPPVKYYIGAIADVNGAVTEGDEGNNTMVTAGNDYCAVGKTTERLVGFQKIKLVVEINVGFRIGCDISKEALI